MRSTYENATPNLCFINLKLLRSAREDSNQAISKPIAQSLPRSCIRNKDQMNMATAVGLFKENRLNVLPDDPLVCTLVPEQDRLWRQNPAKSILLYINDLLMMKAVSGAIMAATAFCCLC